MCRLKNQKWLAFFMLCIIANFVSPSKCLAYDFIYDGIAYNITSSSAMTVEVTWKSKFTTSYGCNYSGEVIIPEFVEYNGEQYTVSGIGDYAFGTEIVTTSSGEKYAYSLQSISLPNSIKSVGKRAFYHCWGINQIILPAAIESIEDESFYDCKNLIAVFLLSNTPPSSKYGAFGPNGSRGRCELIVPQKASYLSNPEWAKYNERIVEICSFNTENLIYTGLPQNIPYSSNLSAYDVQVAGNTTQNNSGEYHAEISIACFKNNKELFSVKTELPYKIAKATIEVKSLDSAKIYGDPNPEFTLSYEGFVNNENVEVLEKFATATTTAAQSSNVGKYPITASGAQALNYTFTYKSGELTILPAPLSASITSTSREYGNSNPNFSLSFEGLKNGESVPAWIESPKFVTTATMTSPVGEYPITATATPKNYELNSISDGVLTILPAKLKVIAQNKSRLYYEENPEFTFYYSGFRNGETESIVSNVPSLTTSATMESNSGKYDISISDISAPNYEIQYQTGVLTINPRNLSVNTGIYERSYGEENPAFELTYDGFVSGQNESDLTTPPTAYTNATNTTSVGSYPIYIGGGVAQNYSFKYSQGKLNIVKAEQDIIWNQDLTNLAKGQQVELLAYSTSGLPITYAIDNATVCEVYSVGNKKYLDCIGDGEVQLRATQEGNSNYYSSPRVSKTIIVGGSTPQKPILSIVQLPVGSITTPVNWGSIFAFTLQPNSGWQINAISINGEDFTNRLDKNGTFTTPAITKDSKIIISYEDENASVQDIECSKPKIIGYDGGIKVCNAPYKMAAYIYSVDGYLIKSTICDSNEVLIPLENNATYIIKIGASTCKIRL